MKEPPSAPPPSPTPPGNERPPAMSGDFVVAFEDGVAVEKRASRELAPVDMYPRKDPAPLVDTVIDGKYRVLKRLGGGGMGAVYLAEHMLLQKKVAVKVLLPEWSKKPIIVERFLREARASTRVRHEHVIAVQDHGITPEGLAFMVMEYLEGQELRHLLQQEGPLPWPRVRGILRQIVSALSAAHAKYVYHRDLKPANIFMAHRPGGGDFVKIIDFGIAKIADEDETRQLTRSGMSLGTADYMSPEQARGRAVSHLSDQYSLGIVAYEMLTGRVPFHDDTFMGTLQKHVFAELVPPRDVAPEISPSVDFLVCRMLEKEPEKRFLDMDEVARALELIEDDGQARGAGGAGAAWKAVLFWSLLFSLLALAVGAWWWVGH
jgi:eukaryotic-like serine/threonine-protein kinase